MSRFIVEQIEGLNEHLVYGPLTTNPSVFNKQKPQLEWLQGMYGGNMRTLGTRDVGYWQQVVREQGINLYRSDSVDAEYPLDTPCFHLVRYEQQS